MLKIKKNEGITLIALVITIIILLILAGIAISQLTNSGLFRNVQTAKSEHENAQEREDDVLKQYENAIQGDYVTENSRDTVTISSEEYARLLNASNTTNYSADERVIGTWLDGKKLYQKTITTTLPTVTTDGVAVTNTILLSTFDIENPDMVWIDYGKSFKLMKTGHTEMLWSFNISTTNGNNIGSMEWINPDSNNNPCLWVRNTRITQSGATCYITIQYTKTTDIAPATN